MSRDIVDTSGPSERQVVAAGIEGGPADQLACVGVEDTDVTIYASASHAYAVIAGLRWDTVGDARGSGPRWHLAGTPPAGFVARHPPGY